MMSNTEWHMGQCIGDAALQNPDKSLEMELRELLSIFLDSMTLPEHPITKEQWERACLLCGRCAPPFLPYKTGE